MGNFFFEGLQNLSFNVGHFYITCVEVIKQYYETYILLEIVWKLVGNGLDFFGNLLEICATLA